MHVFNILSAILLASPALALPLPPSCDNILSFTESGRYSIRRIQSFCGSSLKASTKLHRRALNREADIPEEHLERWADEEYIQRGLWLSDINEEDLHSSISVPAPAPVSARLHPAPSEQPARQIIRSKKQGHAPSCKKYNAGYFQRRSHGMLLAFLSMSEDLAVAGAVAVLVVLAILVAADRWLRARVRAAQYE